MFDMTTATPEFMAELEERSKKFGFTTVQDYLVHLVLVDKKLNTGMGKTKKIKEVRPPKADEIKVVTWTQLVGYLRDNCKEFTKITFLAPDITATLDSSVSTGGELDPGILLARINKYIRDIGSKLKNSHIVITVCHNGQNIGFLKGKDDDVFGVKSGSLAGQEIVNNWFEEDSEG